MGVWSFHLDQHPYSGGRRLFLLRSDGDRHFGTAVRGVVTDFSIMAFDRGAAPPDQTPLAETREDQQDNIGDVTNFLQAALDCAWEAGMRPKGYEDNRAELNGELNATKRHLEDMRKIAKVPGV